MTERRRPPRRGRTPRPKHDPSAENGGEDNPYREAPLVQDGGGEPQVPEFSQDGQVERVMREPDVAPAGDAPAAAGEAVSQLLGECVAQGFSAAFITACGQAAFNALLEDEVVRA